MAHARQMCIKYDYLNIELAKNKTERESTKKRQKKINTKI